MRNIWFNFRIDSKIKESIRRAANKVGRSMSNYIIWLHKEFLKKKKLDK